MSWSFQKAKFWNWLQLERITYKTIWKSRVLFFNHEISLFLFLCKLFFEINRHLSPEHIDYFKTLHLIIEFISKSTTQTTDNTLSLLLWGNTDSQWTGRQIWIFWTQLQSHQQAISKASCLACHMLINNNYMKTFSSTISQNPLIYSIVLLCSLNTFPSQRFWEPIIPITFFPH